MIRYITAIFVRLSLPTRIFLLSTATISITVFFIFTRIFYDDIEELKTRFATILVTQQLPTLCGSVSNLVVVDDYASIRQTFRAFLNHPDIDEISFTTPDGAKIEVKDKPVPPKTPIWFKNVLLSGTTSATKDIIIGGRNYGTLKISVTPQTAINRMWNKLTNGIIVLIISVTLYSILLFLLLRRGFEAPLEALRKGVLEIEAGGSSPSEELRAYGTPEFKTVLDAFNKMAFSIKTDKHKLEKMLEFTRALFENNAAGILIVDEKRIIQQINLQASRIYGYDRDELLGKNTKLLYINDEFYRNWTPVFHQTPDGIYTASMEYIVKHKDGHPVWCFFVGSRIQLENNQDGIMWSIIDISKTKKIEQELQQINSSLETRIQKETNIRLTQERVLMQQSRNAAMGEMIGAIAHQWRQPLNALGIMVQDIVLAYDYGEADRAYTKEFASKAMEQIQFMSKTIDDFRNFFKTDKEVSDFSVNTKLADIIHLLQPQLTANGIALTQDITCDMTVTGMPNEFGQVLLNICTNAKDALIEQKTTNPYIHISIISTTHTDVTISIQDNGGGIKTDIIDKIFDPYFSTKGPNKGTGIGLYIAKTIIESHMGGRLSVQNKDEGALFEITLPAKEG